MQITVVAVVTGDGFFGNNRGKGASTRVHRPMLRGARAAQLTPDRRFPAFCVRGAEFFLGLVGIVYITMVRRRLTWFLVLVLLSGSIPVQAVSMLVCRITGQRMAPVEAPPETLPKAMACCAVKRTTSPSGRTRLELAAPGCCDLSILPARPELPSAAVPVFFSFALALSPAPRVVFTPPMAEATAPSPVLSDAPPRGPPPGRPTSLRAPPFFS